MESVTNQFRVMIVVSIVLAVVIFAGFVYMVFLKEPGQVSRSIELIASLALA